MDQNSEPLVGEAQVGKQLLSVHGCDGFDRLNLDDHFILNDQVGAESGLQVQILPNHRERLLPHKLQPTFG